MNVQGSGGRILPVPGCITYRFLLGVSCVWRDAGYSGLDLQERNSSQKKLALHAFLGYNTVEHLEM